MNQTLVKMVIYKGMRDQVTGREIEAGLDFSQDTLFCRFELRTMRMFSIIIKQNFVKRG